MKKRLLIFGAGETATIANEFFTVDTREDVAGFIVDDHMKGNQNTHLGLPLYGLSQALSDFSPSRYKVFIGLSYGQLNRERLRVFNIFKNEGYEFGRYVSSQASVWRTASVGDNCMIFEGNNIQHNAKIDDNVILWSGNHVGHGSRVGHSTYISSHVCLAGFSNIKERCFLGINSSVTDYTVVMEDCFIGAQTLINKNTEPNSVYTGNPGIKNERVTALKLLKVKL